MKQSFKATITQEEGKNATGIQVPAEVVEAMGQGKRPKVVVYLKDFSYRSTVAPAGDVFMLPLSQERREAAGVEAGEQVEVTLEPDLAPRTVDVPEDLAAALAAQGLREVFDALAPSRRKEYVRQVESAKAEETRQRRIDKIVAELGA
jgi:hypothetical protein